MASVNKKKKKTKKKTKKKVIGEKTSKKAKKRAKSCFNRDGELAFSKDDLSKLELATYKFQNLQQKVVLANHEIVRKQAAYSEELKRMSQQIDEDKKLVLEYRKYLTTVREQLEGKYQINMNEISYDDDTGKIFIDSVPILES